MTETVVSHEQARTGDVSDQASYRQIMSSNADVANHLHKVTQAERAEMAEYNLLGQKRRGICKDCGHKIPDKRREVKWFAIRCAPCEERSSGN